MERKEYLELAIKAAEVFGELHDSGVINAQNTILEIGSSIVEALNEGYHTESNELGEEFLSEYSTKELHEELTRRSGITEVAVSLGDNVIITTQIKDNFKVNTVEGPARILINHD